jgi:hypothetical protein
MRTNTASDSQAAIERYRKLVSGPLEIIIDGAEAYWLADGSGQRLTPESTRTLAPLAKALELDRSGRDPDDLHLYARLANGERYEISSGLLLVDMAEGAAGIPRRPRTAKGSRTT